MNNLDQDYKSFANDRQSLSSENHQRDLPLLVGYQEGPALLADLGWDGSDKALVADAMGSVACSAVLADRAGRGVSFSLRTNFYTGLQRRYHPTLRLSVIRQAVLRLEAMGLIDVAWGVSWAQGGKGTQSSLRATPRLIERAGDRAFQRPRLKELVRLYDLDGRLMTYDETAETRAMRRDLQDWNADLRSRKIVITDPSAVYLDNGAVMLPTKDESGEFMVRLDQTDAYRRFKGDFEHVGRCFGPGYQSATKTARSTIEIDLGPTGSVDFGCSHLRMAYDAVGANLGGGDAYSLPGYEGARHRKRVKRFTNIMFNCDEGRHQALETIAWEIAKEDRVLELGTEEGALAGPYEYRAANRAMEAIERHHAPIEGVFYTGAGVRFMKVETDIIVGAATTARRDHGISLLGVHDEVIGPADKLDLIRDIMAAEWSKRISVQPIVNKC